MPGIKEVFIVDIGGVRLDAFLTQQLVQYSRTYMKGLILQGCVKVDGALASPDRQLKSGARVEISQTHPAAEPNGLSLKDWIIHEDKQLLVLNKPSGLLMHPMGPSWLKAPEAALSGEPNLAAVLFAQRAETSGKLPRCGIVHRLDKQTSGVLLVAKTLLAQQRLQQDFKDRRIEKIYRAIVRGAPTTSVLRIDAPIGRKEGHRRIIVTPFGRPSQTAFKVVEARKTAAIVEAKPLTGRTHQIRAHLGLLGHPVMGDPEHDNRKKLPWPERFMLHAYRIAFDHPATGKRTVFKASLPADFKAFWSKMK